MSRLAVTVGPYTRPKTVTHPGTNRARRALTSFMRRTPLTTTPRRQLFNFVNRAAELAADVCHCSELRRDAGADGDRQRPVHHITRLQHAVSVSNIHQLHLENLRTYEQHTLQYTRTSSDVISDHCVVQKMQ